MTLANWRDLAVVLLALEAFIMALLPAAALFFMVKGMSWVHRKLRRVFPTVQGYFRKAATVTDQASVKIAAPIIAADAFATQARYWRSWAVQTLRQLTPTTKEV